MMGDPERTDYTKHKIYNEEGHEIPSLKADKENIYQRMMKREFRDKE